MAGNDDRYLPLLKSTLDSSLWRHPNHDVARVFLTMSLMADANGYVAASRGAVADRAHLPEDRCNIALDLLLAPDADSRNPSASGKRVFVADRGFVIPNLPKIREELRLDSNKKAAERMKRYRDRHSVTMRNVAQQLRNEAQQLRTETETETETDIKEKEKEKESDSNFPSENKQQAGILDDLVRAAGGALEVNRAECLLELERLRPLLTPLTIDPVVDWLEAQQTIWRQRPPQYRKHLATIIRTVAWTTVPADPAIDRAAGASQGISDHVCSRCGESADGMGRDDAGQPWYWCRGCQPKKWERLQGVGDAET